MKNFKLFSVLVLLSGMFLATANAHIRIANPHQIILKPLAGAAMPETPVLFKFEAGSYAIAINNAVEEPLGVCFPALKDKYKKCDVKVEGGPSFDGYVHVPSRVERDTVNCPVRSTSYKTLDRVGLLDSSGNLVKHIHFSDIDTQTDVDVPSAE